MHIFYLTVDRYHQYRNDIPPGEKNPGGGISDKTICVLDAWKKFYEVGVGEDITESCDCEMLVVEPLWFRLRGGLLGLLKEPDLEEAVEAYENHPAKVKVVYTSEFGFIKIPKFFRDRIIQASSVVTTNCEYQRGLFQMLGIESVHLCDPVDDTVFFNDVPKTLSVVAMGKISPHKNSPKVIEIFKALGAYPEIQRVYIGGSSLWGNASVSEKRLDKQMMSSVDVYYPNLGLRTLSDTLAPMACGIMDTIHDSCSASFIGKSMNGILIFYGLHGAWEGRPGIGPLDTVQDFVDAIGQATSDFSEIPDNSYAETARKWAMENYSQAAFLDDWSRVRDYVKV